MPPLRRLADYGKCAPWPTGVSARWDRRASLDRTAGGGCPHVLLNESSKLSQVVGSGEHGQLQATGDTELVKDVAEVALYGVFADGEVLCDVFVTFSRANLGNNFQFTRGEAVVSLSGAGPGVKGVESDTIF